MIQRTRAYLIIALACTLVSLQAATANGLMPQQQHITDKAQGFIEQKVAQKGKSSARSIHEQLKTAYANEKNPYVRASLFGIMSWIANSYGTTKVSTEVASTLKSGKKTFLKDGKPFEVAAIPRDPTTPRPVEQEHGSALDLDDEDENHIQLHEYVDTDERSQRSSISDSNDEDENGNDDDVIQKS